MLSDVEAAVGDLGQLREDFPEWRFGTVWASAASGPDRRRLWARRGNVLLSAWNAAGLREAINHEQRHGGDEP
jgi:hypothetical protein